MHSVSYLPSCSILIFQLLSVDVFHLLSSAQMAPTLSGIGKKETCSAIY
jgi:hypothetical protein